MNDMQKLRLLIPLWMEHNEEHAEEYRCWAEGSAEVSADLMEAVEAMRRANRALNTVLEQLEGSSSNMTKEIRSLWELLLLTHDASKPVKLTCEECFILLGYDADLLASGSSLEEIRPAVARHLALCSTCRTKFDEWLEDLNRTQFPHHLN